MKLNLPATPTQPEPSPQTLPATSQQPEQGAKPPRTLEDLVQQNGKAVQPAAETPAPIPAPAVVPAAMPSKPTLADHVMPPHQTAIDMSVPASYTEAQLYEFQEMLKMVRSKLEPTMVGQALRKIMVDLRTHPEFIEIMQPEDFGGMIRTLKESFNVAVTTKKFNARGKKSAKNSAKVDNMLNDLSDIANMVL